MGSIEKSTPANDSVNLSPISAVSAEQIRAVIKFLPILESINPEDLERVTEPSQDPQATPEGQRAAVNFRFADIDKPAF